MISEFAQCNFQTLAEVYKKTTNLDSLLSDGEKGPKLENAMRRHGINFQQLETAIRIARCLNEFQIGRERGKNLRPGFLKELYSPDCPTNNAWMIFDGLFDAQNGVTVSERNHYYRRASADPAWPRFLENNSDLVFDLDEPSQSLSSFLPGWHAIYDRGRRGSRYDHSSRSID